MSSTLLETGDSTVAKTHVTSVPQCNLQSGDNHKQTYRLLYYNVNPTKIREENRIREDQIQNVSKALIEKVTCKL